MLTFFVLTYIIVLIIFTVLTIAQVVTCQTSIFAGAVILAWVPILLVALLKRTEIAKDFKEYREREYREREASNLLPTESMTEASIWAFFGYIFPYWVSQVYFRGKGVNMMWYRVFTHIMRYDENGE